MNEMEIPAQAVVDSLRNEIARLNDERITLLIKLDHANQVIAQLTAEDDDSSPDER